jgi:hypothetical protein
MTLVHQRSVSASGREELVDGSSPVAMKTLLLLLLFLRLVSTLMLLLMMTMIVAVTQSAAEEGKPGAGSAMLLLLLPPWEWAGRGLRCGRRVAAAPGSMKEVWLPRCVVQLAALSVHPRQPSFHAECVGIRSEHYAPAPAPALAQLPAASCGQTEPGSLRRCFCTETSRVAVRRSPRAASASNYTPPVAENLRPVVPPRALCLQACRVQAEDATGPSSACPPFLLLLTIRWVELWRALPTRAALEHHHAAPPLQPESLPRSLMTLRLWW